MVVATKVNTERVYYNYQGQLPPVSMEPEPVQPPAPSEDQLPKLITDTTLRDGAQDSRIAIFPAETRVKYYELLQQARQRLRRDLRRRDVHLPEARRLDAREAARAAASNGRA